MIVRTLRALIKVVFGACLALGSLPALAGGTTPLNEAPILHVSYRDESGRSEVSFTMAELNALPQSGFETTTIWSAGQQRFDGVLLKDIAAYVGAPHGMLELSALNEYIVEFDLSAQVEQHALVATSRNGAEMSTRDKGPLWVVFPYDESDLYQTETVFALSIWQMDRIAVMP